MTINPIVVSSATRCARRSRQGQQQAQQERDVSWSILQGALNGRARLGDEFAREGELRARLAVGRSIFAARCTSRAI